MKKEDSEHHKRPATNHKSTPPKIPLSDITMRKEFGNSRMKRNEMSESVIRSVGLCGDDEEELSLGQLVRQRHHKTETPKDAIPVIDLSQSDSDSIESIKGRLYAGQNINGHSLRYFNPPLVLVLKCQAKG
ncbi:hypothetical protein E2C01_020798 [Portunus trituberculatus]|uniref:Uncharacterized protein n=1 Tax=Portunus trituberculatus TaxID=210409 RepID=A0A5B7E4G3_PORTR|nr:hypothetical protein [Portunus trituberculatus]